MRIDQWCGYLWSCMLNSWNPSKPIVPFWGGCTTHFRTYSGDWDVHRRYNLGFDPFQPIRSTSSPKKPRQVTCGLKTFLAAASEKRPGERSGKTRPWPMSFAYCGRTKSISHHLETMVDTLSLLVFTGNHPSRAPLFSGTLFPFPTLCWWPH